MAWLRNGNGGDAKLWVDVVGNSAQGTTSQITKSYTIPYSGELKIVTGHFLRGVNGEFSGSYSLNSGTSVNLTSFLNTPQGGGLESDIIHVNAGDTLDVVVKTYKSTQASNETLGCTLTVMLTH